MLFPANNICFNAASRKKRNIEQVFLKLLHKDEEYIADLVVCCLFLSYTATVALRLRNKTVYFSLR